MPWSFSEKNKSTLTTYFFMVSMKIKFLAKSIYLAFPFFTSYFSKKNKILSKKLEILQAYVKWKKKSKTSLW